MRRNNGEGTWGTKTINGYEYVRYRAKINGSYKEFYGKTRKEVQNIADYVTEQEGGRGAYLDMAIWVAKKLRGKNYKELYEED